jgi:hypothetical protein
LDTLVRLSPGCENAKDLVADLQQGLEKLSEERASRKAEAVGAD